MEQSKSNEEDVEVALAFENVKARVLRNIQKPVRTIGDLERFLRGWWCRHYNRPYRDPLVEEYTIEDLLVEYLDIYYRNNPKALEEENPATKKAAQEDENWIEKMTKVAEGEDEEFEEDRAEKRKRYQERLKTEGLEQSAPKPVVEQPIERHVKFLGE